MFFRYVNLILVMLSSFSLYATEDISPPVIMNYNVYMLDHKISGQTQPVKRAELLGKSNLFDNIDVITFNELFDNESSTLLMNAIEPKFPYFTPVLGRQEEGWDDSQGWSSLTPEDGGVVVMSKFPIEYQAQQIFSQSCGADSFSQKGFIHAIINKDGSKYHIIATHVQADDSLCNNPAYIRLQQFHQINQYIVNADIPSNEMVLIAGDLNVIKTSPEFNSMLNSLNALEPQSYAGADYSWDPSVNALAYDKYPNMGGQLLDYILIEKNHLHPKYWHNQVLDVISPRFEMSGTIETYYLYEYSGHFPVVAFEYADEYTPTRSFRASNAPYDTIQLQHVESKKYITADADNANGWLNFTDDSSQSASIFKLDTWLPESAYCVRDGDYVQLSRTDDYDDYYWNWQGNYYYTKYNNASIILK